MKLTVLGCSGSVPGPESPASGYLIQDQGYTLLLDLGHGAFGALQRHVAPTAVDAIVVSHLHADHFYDISGYYVVRTWHPEGEMAPLPTWGPAGMKRQIAAGYGLEVHPGMDNAFDVRVYDGKPVTVGPFTVHTAALKHPIQSFGFRLEAGGACLVYSGDTGPCDELVELSRGADLLLCEAAFRADRPDNPPDLHMTGREAGDLATRAAARRLVLTHIPPTVDGHRVLAEARPAYEGPIDLAAPGATHSLQ